MSLVAPEPERWSSDRRGIGGHTKGERFMLMVTGALAVWNVGIAFVVGVAAHRLNKKGFLRI